VRAETAFLLVLSTIGCSGETEHAAPTRDATASRSSIPAAVAEPPEPEAPKLAYMPPGQPDAILSEKLIWLRHDVSGVLGVTISDDGQVSTVEVLSSFPQGNALAAEFAQDSATRFRQARFEPLSGVRYPYTFKVTVRFPAPRDADGRLK